MAGSPKKRARRLALEQARLNGTAPPAAPIPPKPTFVPTPEVVRPRIERQVEEDPIVAIIEAREKIEGDGWVDETPAAEEPTNQKDKIYSSLLSMALDRAVDIMSIKPHHTCAKCGFEEGDPNFDKQILTRQASIIASVLSTTARIDEARLRGRVRNKVDEILTAIRAEQTKQAESPGPEAA